MKRCSKCGIVKPYEIKYFGLNCRDGSFHLRPECRECQRKVRNNYNKKHKKLARKYYQYHKEELKEKSKQYRLKHPATKRLRNNQIKEDLLNQGFKKCGHCKEIKSINEFYKTQSLCKKCYNLTHSEHCKNWRIKNKQKWYINIIKYQKKRFREDLNFRILKYLRTRLYQALKGKDKSARTLELLGCSVEYLKKRLESKFVEGMSWDNYGKWHVDHIRPCASFDLTKPSEQRKCFHYTNLQPLWAEENRAKGNKIVVAKNRFLADTLIERLKAQTLIKLCLSLMILI